MTESDQQALTRALFEREELRDRITKGEALLTQTAAEVRDAKEKLSRLNDEIDRLSGQDSLL